MAASRSSAVRALVPLGVLSALSGAHGLQAAALAATRLRRRGPQSSQAAMVRVRTCWRALAVVLLVRAALVKQAAPLTDSQTAAVAAVQAAVLVRRQLDRPPMTAPLVALVHLALLAGPVALLVRLMAALVPMVRAVVVRMVRLLGHPLRRVRVALVALALIWPVVPLARAVAAVQAVQVDRLSQPGKAVQAAHTAVVVVPLATTTNWTRILGRGRRVAMAARV